MSASFLVIGNSFPSGHQQNSGGGNSLTDCIGCFHLNYDAQTCCLIILPTAAAATFFVWLFFQKGHLAVALVLAQLLAIILFGILSFLLSYAARKCWLRLKCLLLGSKTPKDELETGDHEEINEVQQQQQQQMPEQVHV